MTEKTPASRYEEPLHFAVVELTNRCNLRCAHCASVSGEVRDDELTTDQWEGIFGDLAELGCSEITLLGGEPFLHPDWPRLARSAASRGMAVSMVTNGLVHPQKVLGELRDIDLALVGVSLDAATPETYQSVRGVAGVDKIARFIEAIRDEGPCDVVAITSFSRLNIHEMEAIAGLVRSLGVTWQVQFVHAVSERFDKGLMLSPREHSDACRTIGEWMLASEDEPWIATMDDFGYFPLDPLHAPLHCGWTGCHAGKAVIGVRANGDVLGCLSLGDPFVEANLLERPLREIWTDPASFARFRRKEELLTGACGACPHAEQCRAGCSAMAWASTGELGDNPYCMRRTACEALRETILAS